jgi:hypothetical protein
MPLSPDNIFALPEAGQWWASTKPLGLCHVIEVNRDNSPYNQGTLEVEVWKPDEPAANQWSMVRGIDPTKYVLLWFKVRLVDLIDEGVRDYEHYKVGTGTVFISTTCNQLYFIAQLGSVTWALSDWELSKNDIYRSHIFQKAPVNPNLEPETRFQRILDDGQDPTESHPNLQVV